MSPATAARPVSCTKHGPMAYDPKRDVYSCGCLCLTIPARELAVYFALTDDEIRLTPPARSD